MKLSMLVTNVRVKNGDNYKNLVDNNLADVSRTYRHQHRYVTNLSIRMSP